MTKSGAYFPGRARRMEAGPLRSLIDAFAGELKAHRHTLLIVSGYEDSARHFAAWLCRCKIGLSQVNEDVVERFARHRCRCAGARRQDRLSPKYVRRVRRFIRFLAERGIVTAIAPRVPGPIDPRVSAYQDWLRHHRGISERTIDRHAA